MGKFCVRMIFFFCSGGDTFENERSCVHFYTRTPGIEGDCSKKTRMYGGVCRIMVPKMSRS